MSNHLPELSLVALSLGCIVALTYVGARGVIRLFVREVAREMWRQRGDGE